MTFFDKESKMSRVLMDEKLTNEKDVVDKTWLNYPSDKTLLAGQYHSPPGFTPNFYSVAQTLIEAIRL